MSPVAFVQGLCAAASFMQTLIIETARALFCVALLGFLIAAAVIHDIRRRLSVHGWGTVRDLKRGLIQPSNVATLEELSAQCDYALETHNVETEDGFLLTLYRLKSTATAKKDSHSDRKDAKGSAAHGETERQNASMLREESKQSADTRTARRSSKSSQISTVAEAKTSSVCGDGNGNGNGRGCGKGQSVLLQHGLFQTCLPFMLNRRDGSLAFVLADQG